MPYHTPDNAPDEVSVRRVSIPDAPEWTAIVMGALLELTYPHNWEQFGSVSPEDAAARALTMYLDFAGEDAGIVLGTMAYQDADDVAISGGVIHALRQLSGLVDSDVSFVADGIAARVAVTGYGDLNNAFKIQTARGSLAAPAAVQSGDNLGIWNTFGYTGSGFRAGADMRIQTSENWDATHGGAQITFRTTPNLSVSAAVALRIHNDKRLEIEGDLDHDGAKAGFRNTPPIVAPTVTGSRGGNAALASALTQLALQGLLIDSTTA